MLGIVVDLTEVSWVVSLSAKVLLCPQGTLLNRRFMVAVSALVAAECLPAEEQMAACCLP